MATETRYRKPCIRMDSWYQDCAPPRAVVESLFGIRPLPPTVGMFGIAEIGRMVQRAEDVSFDFFMGQSPGSIGILSTVHGLPMLLSVCLDAPEQELRAQGMVRDIDVSSAPLRRHPEELILSAGPRVGETINSLRLVQLVPWRALITTRWINQRASHSEANPEREAAQFCVFEQDRETTPGLVSPLSRSLHLHIRTFKPFYMTVNNRATILLC